MPTGLTSKIYNGEDISLRDFILECATQVGGGYQASDYGAKELPRYEAPVLKADTTFYEDRIVRAKNELLYWLKLKEQPDVAQREYDAEQERHRKENEGYMQHSSQIEQRYLTMREKVEQWTPSEPYVGLKEMMLRQLDDSINHDCNFSLPYTLKPIPVEKYVDDHIQWLLEEIDKYKKYIEEERERVREHNIWLKGLYEEIDRAEQQQQPAP